ncbi:AI-2E family transporter [Thermus scotoductus]|uniref:AI-2E family transporter n=1 Tax=Thermus scotoductus TaxID=37636 RepID=UPI0020A43F0C|nr:AI-2E family transporter [Thermus scotoductus]
MREAFARVWENPYVRVLVYLLFFFLLYRFLLRAWPALSILLTAFAIAYLTHPVVRFFEGKRLPRLLGVVLVYLGLGLLGGLASFLTAQTVLELSRLAQELPRLLDPFLAWLLDLPGRVRAIPIPETLKPVLAEAGQSFQGLVQGFLDTLVRWLQGLIGQGGNLLGFFISLLGGVFQLLTALTLSVYFLYDLPRLAQAALRVFPEPYQPLVAELAHKLDQSVGGYVRGHQCVALVDERRVGGGP